MRFLTRMDGQHRFLSTSQMIMYIVSVISQYSQPSAADSFDYKTFFAKVGLAAKSADEVKKAFAVIDQDNSGVSEEEELK